MATCTTPFPVPDAPLAIEMNDELVTAVHVHDAADAVTLTATVPPAASIVTVSGEIEKVHGAAACVAVNVCPAIVTVPLRASAVLAANDSETVPLPVPLAPDAIVTHAALDAAVQAHVDADAVTVTDPLPPDAATL
jgi:hypothetical protein